MTLQRLQAAWRRWVGFWAEVEQPHALAMVRICLGLVVFWEFMEIWQLDLVVPLFGARDAGGLSDSAQRPHPPLAYLILPATALGAKLLHATITLSAFSFLCGLFTRTSALILLLSWAQFSMVLPAADRGIDTLCRDVLLIFVFAPGGAVWSIDAMIRTGRFAGDGEPVVAWARRLIMLQLVVMYFMAGVQKGGVHWWPMGYFAALYFILQDPAIARFDFTYLETQPFFFLTQVGTAGTVLFQISYPLVFLWIYFRNTPGQPGRLRAFANRWHLEWIWIATGAFFHVALAVTTELGIFPYAMLALYPAWLRPSDVDAIGGRLRSLRQRLRPS